MAMQLEQAQEQRLALTQGLRTSLNVLRMNCFELAGFLQECATENPLLEYEEGSAQLRAERSLQRTTERSAVAGETGVDPLLNVRGHEKDFRYELTVQLDFMPLEADARRTAHYIVYNLDSRGYLPVSAEEVERDLRCGMDCVHRALAAVQELDPPGVGARDLRECLLLQLARLDGEYPVERAVLEHGLLEELAQKRYADIARTLGVPGAAVERAAAVIRGLEPIPLNGEAGEEPLKLAIPEIEIVWTGARFEAALIDGMLPRLRVNAQWEATAALEPDAQEYVTQKAAQARELITWVDHRKETLLRCAREIAATQQDFFARGMLALRPMQMKTLAERLGCHISTVSRALSGKYLECRWGVLELNWFFRRAADGAEGADLSTTAVQARIAELIANEDKGKPLSDQALANELAHGGVELARRTVAKYREALGLPAAQMRRTRK